jgi:acetoin utilization deacetylase AcuC-like enzyme
MNVTPRGFAALTRAIMDIADQCCAGKVVLTLEGGYDLYGERDSVKEVLKELAGLTKTNPTELTGSVMQELVDNVVARVKSVHGQYWKNL